MEATLRRGHGERLRRLGTFDVVEMRKDTVERTRERLSRSSAAGRPRPVYHTSGDRVPFVPEGTLLLRFRDGATKREIDEVLVRHDLAVERAAERHLHGDRRERRHGGGRGGTAGGAGGCDRRA